MRKTFILHLVLCSAISYGLVNLFSFNFLGLEILALLIVIFLLLWLSSFIYYRSYFNALKGVISLAFYFLKELIISNFRVIYFILSPGHKFRPAILELPLSLKSEFSITLLANLITLTPGTITLEISKDKKSLFFHVIDVPEQDLDKAKQKIKNGFEKRIMKIKS
ncbi:Na+/H+ antiporter subunit E [Marivirga sp.]|uniref:Na+/H+ antiporter subunit E n=1 Tax=Marivirga sp. TaxID=2018662 RepID=UPI0025E04F18|nr:Na+/H+ antiporter subunit E [Marivirga sp.]